MYVQMGKREDLIKDFVFITGVGRNRYVGGRKGGRKDDVCVTIFFCMQLLMYVNGLDGSLICFPPARAHTDSGADTRKFILTHSYHPPPRPSLLNSEMPFEPVLRPAMQRMLTEDFDPPLPCEFVEHNAGRLVVRAHDLIQWLNAQVRDETIVE